MDANSCGEKTAAQAAAIERYVIGVQAADILVGYFSFLQGLLFGVIITIASFWVIWNHV